MVCRLLALDKRPGVRPVGIGETLRRDLDKIVMRAAGYQENTSCGNLQLCTGLEVGIEDKTPAVGQKRLKRSRARRIKKDARITEEDESENEEAGRERI